MESINPNPIKCHYYVAIALILNDIIYKGLYINAKDGKKVRDGLPGVIYAFQNIDEILYGV